MSTFAWRDSEKLNEPSPGEQQQAPTQHRQPEVVVNNEGVSTFPSPSPSEHHKQKVLLDYGDSSPRRMSQQSDGRSAPNSGKGPHGNKNNNIFNNRPIIGTKRISVTKAGGTAVRSNSECSLHSGNANSSTGNNNANNKGPTRRMVYHNARNVITAQVNWYYQLKDPMAREEFHQFNRNQGLTYFFRFVFVFVFFILVPAVVFNMINLSKLKAEVKYHDDDVLTEEEVEEFYMYSLIMSYCSFVLTMLLAGCALYIILYSDQDKDKSTNGDSLGSAKADLESSSWWSRILKTVKHGIPRTWQTSPNTETTSLRETHSQSQLGFSPRNSLKSMNTLPRPDYVATTGATRNQQSTPTSNKKKMKSKSMKPSTISMHSLRNNKVGVLNSFHNNTNQHSLQGGHSNVFSFNIHPPTQQQQQQQAASSTAKLSNRDRVPGSTFIDLEQVNKTCFKKLSVYFLEWLYAIRYSYQTIDTMKYCKHGFLILAQLVYYISFIRNSVLRHCESSEIEGERGGNNMDTRTFQKPNSVLPEPFSICDYPDFYVVFHAWILFFLPFYFFVALPDISIVCVWYAELFTVIVVFSMTIYIKAHHCWIVLVIFIISVTCLLIDTEIRKLQTFLLTKDLKETLAENERMADENHANEMRHMIANVAHDLKTVSENYFIVYLFLNILV
jgi:hypothetical protein